MCQIAMFPFENRKKQWVGRKRETPFREGGGGKIVFILVFVMQGMFEVLYIDTRSLCEYGTWELLRVCVSVAVFRESARDPLILYKCCSLRPSWFEPGHNKPTGLNEAQQTIALH